MDTVNFTPVDLPLLEQQLTKFIKKVQTDKDLENEVAEISVILKDLSKYHHPYLTSFT